MGQARQNSGLRDRTKLPAPEPWKKEILAIFNSGRCSMPQNDPANNLKWNSKEKHQFFLAKSARLGSKKCHQKYILTVEQAQSIFENSVCY